MKNITSELVGIARELTSASHDFTRLVPLRFKPEGSTMNSLANARMIKDAGYIVSGSPIFLYDTVHGNYELEVFFARGDGVVSWTFTGFSAFYSGEGPRGLIEFGKIFDWNLKPNLVASRPEDLGISEDKGVVAIDVFM